MDTIHMFIYIIYQSSSSSSAPSKSSLLNVIFFPRVRRPLLMIFAVSISASDSSALKDELFDYSR